MPSLRRTFSSPARCSPYNSTQTRTNTRSPRRSSGSDTTNRRVLADIDWWRVEEGQREVRGLAAHEQLHQAAPVPDDEEVDQEQRQPAPVADAALPTPAAPSHNVGSGSDVPLWHNVPGAGWDAFDAFEQPSFGSDDVLADPFEMPSAIDQFAALSLNPIGRASLHRSVSSSSAFSDISYSSDSSSSTPTLSPTALTMGFEDFGAAPTDDSDDELETPYAVLSRASRRPSSAPTMVAASHLFVEDELSFSRDRFNWFSDDDESSSDLFSRDIPDNDDFF